MTDTARFREEGVAKSQARATQCGRWKGDVGAGDENSHWTISGNTKWLGE